MRNIISLTTIFCLLLTFSCNDGDVFDVELDFEDTFRDCGDEDVLFYKTKEDPSETLSVLINNFNTDIFFADKKDTLIEKTNVDFIYRTYSNKDLPNDLFCNIVSPADLVITSEDVSKCDADFIVALFLDDNDNIPTEIESTDGSNPLADNDADGIPAYLDDNDNDDTIGDDNKTIEANFDTDNDEVPNFIDADDDGDNVLTKDENPEKDDDGNSLPLENQDSDDDGIPNYLDNDDDGDGIPTINEDIDGLLNPENDFINGSATNRPYYLDGDKNENLSVDIKKYRTHTYTEEYTVRLTVKNIRLDFLSQDVFEFGTLAGNESLSNTITAEPVFK